MTDTMGTRFRSPLNMAGTRVVAWCLPCLPRRGLTRCGRGATLVEGRSAARRRNTGSRRSGYREEVRRLMPIREQAKRERLVRDGFCVFESVLDAATVALK